MIPLFTHCRVYCYIISLLIFPYYHFSLEFTPSKAEQQLYDMTWTNKKKKKKKMKKVTHMWSRRDTPQNFCFTFIDELEKQQLIKNTVEMDH